MQKKKVIIIICVCLFVVTIIYTGIITASLINSNIQQVVFASMLPEDHDYPPHVAEYYLFNHRGDGEDIAFIERYYGVIAILNIEDGPSEKARRYVSFFINKGLDINAVGSEGYTHLQSAIKMNKANYVEYLLSIGADPMVKVGDNPHSAMPASNAQEDAKRVVEVEGLSALELAIYINRESKENLNGVIDLLENHMGK